MAEVCKHCGRIIGKNYIAGTDKKSCADCHKYFYGSKKENQETVPKLPKGHSEYNPWRVKNRNCK